MLRVTPVRIEACTFVLGVLAFAAFWGRANIAGMLLVLSAVCVVGLGFGHLLDSPCPVSPPQKPEVGMPLVQPEPAPPFDVAAHTERELDRLIAGELPLEKPAIPGESAEA